MSTRNNIKYSQRIKLRQKIDCISVDSRLNPSFANKKTKILYSSKSSLNSILCKIKNIQLDYLSTKSQKNINIKTLNIKHILSILKNELLSMLKEKTIIQKYFMKENEKIKTKAMRHFHPGCSLEDGGESDDNITIGNEKLYQSQTSQLKLLNFQIENEILNTNNIIARNSEIIYNLKINPFYISENNEIFCVNNYNNISKVSDILHYNINSKRKEFMDIVNMKSEQDMEIKELLMKKECIKNIIKKKENNNKYIITEDIINEDSKEYTENYTKTKNNSNITININNQNNYNQLKLQSNGAINKNLYKINQDKFIRKRLIFSKTVSPKFINNIYQIKNNLNNLLINKSNKEENSKENEDESILKSFNSSLDESSSYHQNNTGLCHEINLNLNESKNIKTNLGGLNENENIATDNNSGSKSNKNNQYSFVFNITEKQNDEADFIFTISQKEKEV